MNSLISKRDWLMVRREEEVVTAQGGIILDREIRKVEQEINGMVSLPSVGTIKASCLARAKAEFLQRQANRLAKAGNLALAKSLANEAVAVITLLGETR
jgi:hypothetical protein